MKTLDRYIIKTFFGPFLFIFSVLFFIFIVNIIWIQMAQFIGKGLTYWEISKLLFYLGVNVVSLVLPLTILLSSIMTYGGFGERYELAAMKAAGISLTRTMAPLFFVSIALAATLFLFQNNISPDFQRKAKNMLYNIASSKPALNFTPGQFNNQLPGYAVKFDKISGEKGENINGVFIHKRVNSYEDQQAIVAKRGRLLPAVANKNYLKFKLYDGYVYDDYLRDKNYNERLNQPNQRVKFDTLVIHFDISELINKALEEEKITEDYRFQTFLEINNSISTNQKNNKDMMESLSSPMLSSTSSSILNIQNQNNNTKAPEVKKSQINIKKMPEKMQLQLLMEAYNRIEGQKNEIQSKLVQIEEIVKYHNRMIMYQQRLFASSITCIIFFLIGASLGSIIRKGGMGFPVVMAIIVFIVFYVLNLSTENLSWKGKMNPYLASWLPNIVLFPFGVWLTYKALADSQLFDTERYKRFFAPIINLFLKSKEHQRYQ